MIDEINTILGTTYPFISQLVSACLFAFISIQFLSVISAIFKRLGGFR